MFPRSLFARLARQTDGAGTVEFGLVLAFITLLAFSALKGLATVTTATWNDISTQVATAVSAAG